MTNSPRALEKKWTEFLTRNLLRKTAAFLISIKIREHFGKKSKKHISSRSGTGVALIYVSAMRNMTQPSFPAVIAKYVIRINVVLEITTHFLGIHTKLSE